MTDSSERADAVWRARWEQSPLRERLDEPIERATKITRKTLAWFPIRVWRHFLRANGFLLAAAISYQSLFAIFAVIYFGFAIVGIWLGGSEQAIDGLIQIVNLYIPGLIGAQDGQGLVSEADVAQIAQESASVLAITGAVAFVAALWTAIGFVTFTRRAVRDIFGLPFDTRSYVLLKARDFLAAALFGLALVVGAVLATIAAGAIELLFRLFDWPDYSGWVWGTGRVASAAVAFAINTAAIAALIRFLTGTSLRWRLIAPGAALGGAAMVVLQYGAGILLSYSPSNPLLATFSVFVGFLLWFRLVGIVILVAASWVALTAQDADVPIEQLSEDEQRRREHAALLLAARIRVRDAHLARGEAPWWGRWSATRELRRAEDDLARIEADTPPPRRGLLLD
ncbi:MULTISPECIES: YihY/virulence factor BrkB family protein [Microbacterium]|uniref:Ribonuclease BN n=1 Tax=Microbacterium hominis TaxID=162426 RepID=A0A134DDU9_9MICO|nr:MULTISPECIES: YihY/virulence factor BrkB family protein [Microbacterium]AUG30471.1 ribonuclease BN [Microbacterium hominis]KXC04719.1 ribonuclease BN [Microbacterium hominis]QOC26232.1 YihY/virulence factor BrkB family protein [Microbacterium hominis]QOC30189.1 YihY/virulence factor BrkB family protein [Microbacterium hominis]QYF97462.1 YihY/virulence factor BrkB family protein [Microbacterium sp. PAMC21962]